MIVKTKYIYIYKIHNFMDKLPKEKKKKKKNNAKFTELLRNSTTKLDY